MTGRGLGWGGVEAKSPKVSRSEAPNRDAESVKELWNGAGTEAMLGGLGDKVSRSVV